jgi:hypothetical protein
VEGVGEAAACNGAHPAGGTLSPPEELSDRQARASTSRAPSSPRPIHRPYRWVQGLPEDFGGEEEECGSEPDPDVAAGTRVGAVGTRRAARLRDAPRYTADPGLLKAGGLRGATRRLGGHDRVVLNSPVIVGIGGCWKQWPGGGRHCRLLPRPKAGARLPRACPHRGRALARAALTLRPLRAASVSLELLLERCVVLPADFARAGPARSSHGLVARPRAIR